MFGRLFVGVAIALAVAGSPATASAAGCDARASMPWTIAPGKHLIAEAISNGADCATAVVTLVLRSPQGKPLWVDSRIGSQVMIFASVSKRSDMERSLNDWIDQRRSTLPRTDALPEWPQGAQAPKAGEFPFLPDADVDREAYVKMRREKLPLFCYVQGMESMACVALSADGGVTKVGVQTFPG